MVLRLVMASLVSNDGSARAPASPLGREGFVGASSPALSCPQKIHGNLLSLEALTLYQICLEGLSGLKC